MKHVLLPLLKFSCLVLFTSMFVFAADPTSVTVAGSLQSKAGCSGDWQADCSATHLTYDPGDDVWQGVFTLPAGSYEYKATLNNAWDENYGLHAAPGGANIPLNLGGNASVKFYYDHKSHWATDNVSSVIATVPGDFQSEIGCSGDWDPSCLRSWLQDLDGDGIYTLTVSIPVGSYECKVAINEGWDTNYGAGGTPGGANIPFKVAIEGPVTFSWDSNTHVLTVKTSTPSQDDNVEFDGLRHDSRDTLYRTPGGAVTAGTSIKVRFRTYHNDVTAVNMRVFDVNANAEKLVPMSIVASDVSCFEDLGNHTCDFWEATLTSKVPDNYWYRFLITDGSSTAYYADNAALDGGLGAATGNLVDNSYALMFYDKNFKSPSWAKDAVMYQIFPDRFRNGRRSNDPKTGDPRYDDPVLALPWGTLPEGYCRAYTDAATNCPWRFDTTPPDYSPTIENARSRDYMGGDLKGIDQQLDYLKWLGVNTIYMNPIFDSASDHGYDTQDYAKIDPYFGTQGDWNDLARHADREDVRLILDGVFNHLSSDSKFFDRYRRFPTTGGCESADSLFRSWFTFRPPGSSEPSPCAPSTPGGNDTYYNGWFGFDSLPVINKSLPAVQSYFVTGNNSVTEYWLRQGASGWRLDVMGDSSFPNGYWEAFRKKVKQTRSDGLIIGELWQKDSTLLRFLRGDRADSTMNYRLRDAVLAFLASEPFDSKGFPDSGHQIKPSEFAARLESQREDYSDATYYSLMNLLDSHDTARLLWVLTPGASNRQEKEFNSANLEEGKKRVRLASLIQFALPGAPTIYYGDEVGVTGNDDPDDRRTYPWDDQGGMPDYNLRFHYKALTTARKLIPALRDGDFKMLLANDDQETVAFGRKTGYQAALLLINRSAQQRTIEVPLAGYIHDNVTFLSVYGVDNSLFHTYRVSGGTLTATLQPESGLLLAALADLTPPDEPEGLKVKSEASKQVTLNWRSTPRAAGYNVYYSPVSGGGWTKANTSLVKTTTYTVTGLKDSLTYYFIVKALDSAGNESDASNEVSAIPHLVIGWANLQYPPTITHTISASNHTPNIYGQVYIDGVTNQSGATEGLQAQLGFGPAGTKPSGNTTWTWVTAAFNTDAGNNDEFVGSLLPTSTGNFDYAYRYSTTNGRDWFYADLGGPQTGDAPLPNPGKLTVNGSGDNTPPAAPTGLVVNSSSSTAIDLSWNAVSGDASLYGYQVLRSTTNGGPYSVIATVTNPSYSDKSVAANTTYYYVVRAVDQSFNVSGYSNQVQAQAVLRTVTLTFNVTVPASTDGTGFHVFIAGTLNRLDGGLPEWNAAGVVLTRVDATHWTITLTGKENTSIEYKYTLGDFNFVEKGGSCDEINNRALTLNYGSNGVQTQNDVVPNWRNVAPCGN